MSMNDWETTDIKLQNRVTEDIFEDFKNLDMKNE